jgi:hypothetical protein
MNKRRKIMENQMFTKPMYKCAICEKIFDNVADRAACETKCVKRVEEEAKRAAEAKKMEEQKMRKAEVDAAVSIAFDLMDKYIEDFDHYEFKPETKSFDEDVLDGLLWLSMFM